MKTRATWTETGLIDLWVPAQVTAWAKPQGLMMGREGRVVSTGGLYQPWLLRNPPEEDCPIHPANSKGKKTESHGFMAM